MNDLVAPGPLVPVPASSVRPGDVLLMRGRSEVSTFIAWVSDSVYSHSAIVADDGQLYEAITHGVLASPLSDRLGPGSPVYLVDAYRPLDRDGAGLDDEARADVVSFGRGLLGRQYATNELALIGAVVAIRGKTFAGAPRWLRWVLREALDSLLADDATRVTCSEYVYRCFAENASRPEGRLAPRILIVPPPDPPTPYTGNVVALVREVFELLHPQRKAALLSSRGLPVSTGVDAEAMLEDVSPVELETLSREARALLGVAEVSMESADGGVPVALGAVPVELSAVNPKGVSPGDLARTPSHLPLGRLMQAPDWSGPG